MFTPKTQTTNNSFGYTPYGTAEFNRRIEEGIRRAPMERAKALKEFWGWIASRP